MKTLATYPGIGEAMAERIVAKLRRKVGKFALIVGGRREGRPRPPTNGQAAENAEPDVIRDTFAALLSVGHTESQARAGDRPGPRRQEEVQERRRHDRRDLRPAARR